MRRTQEVSDGWIATGEALDNIGMILGIERKSFRIMGMARKEPDGAYRGRLRKALMGVRGREEG